MNWNQVIHEFKASGLSQAAFCRQRNITYGTFNKRLLAFGRSELPGKVPSSKPAAALAKESRYVSIVSEDSCPSLIEVATRDGLKLRVPLPHLERVLVALRKCE